MNLRREVSLWLFCSFAHTRIFFNPFLLLTLPKPFLHAPNTSVCPFQSQGKVWVRVSTTEKERGMLLLGNPRIATRLITQCYLNSKNAWIENTNFAQIHFAQSPVSRPPELQCDPCNFGRVNLNHMIWVHNDIFLDIRCATTVPWNKLKYSDSSHHHLPILVGRYSAF